jgi:hypothetical protein
MQGIPSNGTWNPQENGQQQQFQQTSPNSYFHNKNNPADSRGASMLGGAPVQAVVSNL